MQTERWSRASVTMHWLMLVLIALTYAFIELRTMFERGTPERAFMRAAHSSIGLLVLAAVVVRIVARLRGGRPPAQTGLPAWQRVAARLSHGLLYALMIGMPLAGWLLLSLRGDPVVFFGLTLPPLAGENEALAKQLRGWHEDVGRAGSVLIGCTPRPRWRTTTSGATTRCAACCPPPAERRSEGVNEPSVPALGPE